MKKVLLGSIIFLAGTVGAGNDNWIQLSGMQTSRDQFTGCVIGNGIFVFGGNNAAGNNLYSGEKYDMAVGTWSSIADNPNYENPWNDPSGVEELIAAAVNGKFYVFGAYGGSEDLVSGY